MLEKAGKNSGDNRRDNRGLVLRMVATGACRTRRDLVCLLYTSPSPRDTR